MGAASDGDVTADMRGDTVPIYVNSIAGILCRMLESLGLAYDTADFNSTAWASAEADLPGIVGFHRLPAPFLPPECRFRRLRACEKGKPKRPLFRTIDVPVATCLLARA